MKRPWINPKSFEHFNDAVVDRITYSEREGRDTNELTVWLKDGRSITVESATKSRFYVRGSVVTRSTIDDVLPNYRLVDLRAHGRFVYLDLRPHGETIKVATRRIVFEKIDRNRLDVWEEAPGEPLGESEMLQWHMELIKSAHVSGSHGDVATVGFGYIRGYSRGFYINPDCEGEGFKIGEYKD